VIDKKNIPYLVIGAVFAAYLFSVGLDKIFGFSLPMNIIGIPFVIFLPGFALVLSFFNEKEWLEKVVLGVCLSLVVVPILGLILNFTPFGINFISTFFATGLFTLSFYVFAFVNRNKSVNGDV
jgi:uncharacterized membrane protein